MKYNKWIIYLLKLQYQQSLITGKFPVLGLLSKFQSKYSWRVQNEPTERNLFEDDWNFLMSLDKLFILGGKQLKTLIPQWYTAFCTLDRCTEGRYRSEQCLVLIEGTTELDLNIFIFLTTKSNKKSIPCVTLSGSRNIKLQAGY